MTNKRIAPAIIPTVCGHTTWILCSNGSGAPGTEPGWTKAKPNEASSGCWVERTVGSSSTPTISPNKAPGDTRANACSTPKWLNNSAGVATVSDTNRVARYGEISGHRIVRKSHKPNATRAAVAAERKMMENNSASASHTPA